MPYKLLVEFIFLGNFWHSNIWRLRILLYSRQAQSVDVVLNEWYIGPSCVLMWNSFVPDFRTLFLLKYHCLSFTTTKGLVPINKRMLQTVENFSF